MGAQQPSLKQDVCNDAIGKYKLGATIGRGSFGVVKVARHSSSSRDNFAVKIVSRRNDKLMTEIKNHRCMNHPHVVKIHDVIERVDDMCIVMDLVSGGDLFDYILKHHPRMPEREARRIFQQIVAGVKHCHARNIAHRDLKPENIFLDSEGNVKIGDFGLSAEVRAGVFLTESCGSPNYAAPELLYRDCKYEGPEVDMWSLGALLYVSLCSLLPFDAPDYQALFRLIKRGSYSVPGFVGQAARSLIERLLVVDPAMRARIPEVWSHVWFQKDLPQALVEENSEPLPNLLQNRGGSKLAGASQSYTSLEKASTCASLFSSFVSESTSVSTFAPASTTTSSERNTPKDVSTTTSSEQNAPRDARYNQSSYEARYALDPFMYMFSHQFVF